MALADGSFVIARTEPDGLLDLFQYDGATLAEIGVLLNWRGVGVDGSLFDGMVGLVGDGTVPGDADGDGDVDLDDLAVLAAHFLQSTSNGASDGDFDGDGDVDLYDFAILAVNYRTGV